ASNRRARRAVGPWRLLGAPRIRGRPAETRRGALSMGEPRTVRADLMLLGAAGLWGAGFIAQRAAMEHVGPFLFNTLRYAIGAAILLPAAHLVLRRLGQGWDRRLFRDGLVLGSVLAVAAGLQQVGMVTTTADRKSTRLNSSHVKISYAVFCLKKQKNK